MEISNLIPHIESLIFASDKPLTPVEMTELINNAFGFMEDKVEEEQVTTALEGIVEKYNSEFYPFEVRQSGGGWQFLTKKEFHKTVAQLNGEKFLKRLSAAALETLAIIAYKQPITKGEIESIRGVSSDYSVQKLLEKDLIVITGRNEAMPGHPLVYSTSKSFMDYFGINNPEDLPKIKEVLSDQVVPTVVNHTEFEEPSALVVTDAGELIGELDNDNEMAGNAVPPLTDADNRQEEEEMGARLFIQGTTEGDENAAETEEAADESDAVDEAEWEGIGEAETLDSEAMDYAGSDESVNGHEVEGMEADDEDGKENETDKDEETNDEEDV